jgi:hypothetical protein
MKVASAKHSGLEDKVEKDNVAEMFMGTMHGMVLGMDEHHFAIDAAWEIGLDFQSMR